MATIARDLNETMLRDSILKKVADQWNNKFGIPVTCLYDELVKSGIVLEMEELFDSLNYLIAQGLVGITLSYVLMIDRDGISIGQQVEVRIHFKRQKS